MEGEPDLSATKEIADRFDWCECAQLLGMKVTDTWPGGARVVMEAPGKRNPAGMIHGGAIFSLADHAFGLAANLSLPRQVALSASIHYLAPARGTLEAVAEKIAETDDHSLFRVRVYDGARMVALFEGVGIKNPATITE